MEIKKEKVEWKLKKENIIYENAYLKLKEDEVIRANGSEGKYYVVEGIPFVSIFPIDKEDYTYLVGQYRYAIKKFSWENPQGGVDIKNKEDYLTAAKRELLEETGLKANTWKQVGGKIYIANGCLTTYQITFLAFDLEKVSDKIGEGPGEDLYLKKVKISEVEEMILKNEIDDGPTILTYFIYKNYISGKYK